MCSVTTIQTRRYILRNYSLYQGGNETEMEYESKYQEVSNTTDHRFEICVKFNMVADLASEVLGRQLIMFALFQIHNAVADN